MRKFTVTFMLDIEIDETVFARCATEDWRRKFPGYICDEDVVERIAHGATEGRGLGGLYGFADMDDDLAKASALHCHDVEEHRTRKEETA